MPIPVLSVQQMREWENATWASGQNAADVIALVGKRLAERVLQFTRADDSILILAGKGHNGDDARAALTHLRERRPLVLNVPEPEAALEKFRAITTGVHRPAWIIDGLFGIGLNRSLSDDWRHVINVVNESGIPVIAVDVPSGIDAATGEIRGAAIRAEITFTLGAPKSGLFSPIAIPFVGRLEVAPDIGLVPCPFLGDLNWSSAEDFRDFPPRRNVASHKGTYGHLAIVAGSPGYHGAAVLSARGALSAQPGLVSVFTPEKVYVPIASQLQAAMVHPWKTSNTFPASTSAILFGPGLAAKELPENLKSELLAIWMESPLPVIADASALDWLPPGGNFEEKLRVITPHPGEAARMLSASTEAIQNDRSAALRQLSSRHGNCFVVLKGHQTLVGRSDGPIFINSSGNPFLAQGGSGDILAGFIGGLLAQRACQNNVIETIRYAVWRHGFVADQLCTVKPGWTIADLLAAF